MKKIKLLMLAFLGFSFAAQAEIGNVEILFGDYDLQKEVHGECAPQIKIFKKDFLNQRAEYSIAIYGYGGNINGSKIISQLTNLNQGADFHVTRDPAFGFKDGSVYNLEQIDSQKIQAVNRYKNVGGVVLRENILNAEYNSQGIYFETSDLNTLRGDLATHKTKCLYSKKQ